MTMPMKEIKRRYLGKAPLEEVVFIEQFVSRNFLKFKETSTTGLDQLHTRVLRICLIFLATPLTWIFQTMFNNSQYPGI